MADDIVIGIILALAGLIFFGFLLGVILGTWTATHISRAQEDLTEEEDDD